MLSEPISRIIYRCRRLPMNRRNNGEKTGIKGEVRRITSVIRARRNKEKNTRKAIKGREKRKNYLKTVKQKKQSSEFCKKIPFFFVF